MILNKSHRVFLCALLILTAVINPVQSSANEPLAPQSAEARTFGQGDSLWLLMGLGSPGNQMESPSQHVELGFDMVGNETLRFGPYYQIVTAIKKETVTFPSTVYSELRESNISANVLGVQGRWKWNEALNVRVGLGASQTTLRIKSVTTDAPVPSTMAGYEQKSPGGVALQSAAQYLWPTKAGLLGGELGLNVTSLSSNDSFAEIYLAMVIHFSLKKKTPTPVAAPPKPQDWETPNIPME